MIKVFVAATLMACLATGPSEAADRLAGLLWKRRVIIVFADRRDDPRFARQVTALEARRALLADYETTLVCVPGADAALRKRLGVAERGFAVVLVGKDGSSKETWREPVAPERILRLIDAMPMRREEVRARR